MVAIFQQGPRRQARFLDNIGKTKGHTGVENSIWWGQLAGKAIWKVAIGGEKSNFILTTRLKPRVYGSLTSPVVSFKTFSETFRNRPDCFQTKTNPLHPRPRGRRRHPPGIR